MAGLLNPRSREDVRNNSFGDYAEGLLSNAGNSVKDWYTGMHPMDQVAVATAPIPILGDITGATADARMFYEEPESRTWANAGMSAAGLLPFVPALSIAGRKAKTLNPNAPKRPLTEFEQAHSTAQKNAALPTSEGGLGLSKDNTAMDRAKAMGFDVDTPYYHGTDADFNEFKNGYGGVYFTESPSYADRYTAKRGEEGRNIIPALLKTDGLFDTRKAAHRKIYKDKFLNKWGNGTPLRDDGLPDWVEADDYQMFFDEESLPFNSAVVGEPPTTLRDGSFRPEQSLLITKEPNIRSPNAAFDPMKRDSSDILSSAGLLGGYGNRRSFA